MLAYRCRGDACFIMQPKSGGYEFEAVARHLLGFRDCPMQFIVLCMN